MKITRRAMLAASAAFATLIAGCQAPQADQNETREPMTDRTPRHFNDNDELTSDVNNQAVNTEVATTETLGFDYSDTYPHSPRQPEESSILNLQPHPQVSNPVLSPSDVTDASANFVADPFMVYDSGTFHMFFEVSTGTDEWIGHATSADGLSWVYDQLVLDTSGSHFAYPYVVKHGGTWYMLPDRGQDDVVEIYEATSWPTGWTLVETPLTGRHVDPTPFEFNGTWYMFTVDTSVSPQELNLYYSDSLLNGSWTEHPASPVHTGDRNGRISGRPIVREDHVDIWIMDNQINYGRKTRYYRITDLTTSTYTDQELSASPILEASSNGSWTDNGMHHLDVMMSGPSGQTLAVTDGKNENNNWEIGIYTAGGKARTALGVNKTGAAQSVPDSTFTTITFDNKRFDYDNSFDLSADTFTPPTSGVYQISGGMRIDPGTNSDIRLIAQFLNATDTAAVISNLSQIATPDAAGVPIEGLAYLDASKDYSLRLWQNAGASIDVQGAAAETRLEVRRVY